MEATYIWMSTRCPLCGGTYLHAVGCQNKGKSFVSIHQVDPMRECDPKFLEELRWQEFMREGTQVIPIG
jgi:hypothetical protein